MIVMKFGGTSVGDATRMANVARIVTEHRRDDEAIVVVASAMAGVTNDIVRAARLAAQGDVAGTHHIISSLRERHCAAASLLFTDGAERTQIETYFQERLQDLERYCQSFAMLGEVTVRGLDQVVGAGESMAVRLLTGALRREGIAARAVDATGLVVTDGNFGGARPLMAITRKRVREQVVPLIEAAQTPVVTGYIAATEDGIPTTLGRGGSDYSAAILGACLDADEVWIWTDVDGILTADPNIVPQASTLEVLGYAEAAELAYFGADVLHPKTIRPVEERGIALRIRNTFNPSHPGTLVTDAPGSGRRTVPAIISTKGLCLITVEGHGDTWTPQVSAQALMRLSEAGVSVLMFTQSFTDCTLSLLVRQSDMAPCLRTLEHEFERELEQGLLSRIRAQEHVSTISVVGPPGRDGAHVVAQAFAALGRHGLQVLSVAQASSEYNVSFVVPEKVMGTTVRALHSSLELDGLGDDDTL